MSNIISQLGFHEKSERYQKQVDQNLVKSEGPSVKCDVNLKLYRREKHFEPIGSTLVLLLFNWAKQMTAGPILHTSRIDRPMEKIGCWAQSCGKYNGLMKVDSEGTVTKLERRKSTSHPLIFSKRIGGQISSVFYFLFLSSSVKHHVQNIGQVDDGLEEAPHINPKGIGYEEKLNSVASLTRPSLTDYILLKSMETSITL